MGGHYIAVFFICPSKFPDGDFAVDNWCPNVTIPPRNEGYDHFLRRENAMKKKTAASKKTVSKANKPVLKSKAKVVKVSPKEEKEPKMPKSPLSTEEKKFFKVLLQTRKGIIQGDVNKLEDCALKGEDGGRVVPYEHPADSSSESYSQEFLLGIIQNEDVELRQIAEALERIQAGTFGICEGCLKPIVKARLKAIPYARLCVECKREEENGDVVLEK
jgi:DnaK suppressor protein